MGGLQKSFYLHFEVLMVVGICLFYDTFLVMCNSFVTYLKKIIPCYCGRSVKFIITVSTTFPEMSSIPCWKLQYRTFKSGISWTFLLLSLNVWIGSIKFFSFWLYVEYLISIFIVRVYKKKRDICFHVDLTIFLPTVKMYFFSYKILVKSLHIFLTLRCKNS